MEVGVCVCVCVCVRVSECGSRSVCVCVCVCVLHSPASVVIYVEAAHFTLHLCINVLNVHRRAHVLHLCHHTQL